MVDSWLDKFRNESETHKGWVFGYTLAYIIKQASDNENLVIKSRFGLKLSQAAIDRIVAGILKSLRKSPEFQKEDQWKTMGRGLVYSPHMQKKAVKLFIAEIKEKEYQSNNYELFEKLILDRINEAS